MGALTRGAGWLAALIGAAGLTWWLLAPGADPGNPRVLRSAPVEAPAGAPGEAPTERRQDFSAPSQLAAAAGESPGEGRAVANLDPTRATPASRLPRTEVSGQVRALGAGGLEGRRVRLVSRALGARHEAVTDRDGSFSIPGVAPGPAYHLSVPARRQHGAYTRAPLRVPPEGLSLEIVLEPLTTGNLTGRMVDVYGNPLPGMRLRLESSQLPEERRTVRADDQGFFSVEGIPTGELRFSTAEIPHMHVRAIDLPPGLDRDVLLVLDSGDHALRGRVLSTWGEPVPGAVLKLSWVHQEAEAISGSSRVVTSDEAGWFAFSGLGPGPHLLTADAAGQGAAKAVHEVFGETEVEVRLSRDPS